MSFIRVFFFFFFFKQKTAYEMRISDWSSDVCSSDLFVGEDAIQHTPKGENVKLTLGQAFDVTARPKQTDFVRLSDRSFEAAYEIEKIGRASCRERVCQYV